MVPKNPEESPVPDRLSDIEASVREQLAGAFENHAERLCRELASGWRDGVDRVLSGRFGELRGLIEAEILREQGAATARAQRELADRLNQALRRIRAARTREEWSAALLDAARDFCSRAVLFSLSGNWVSAEGGQTPLAEAPAIANVVETRDTVVAARTQGELSQTLVQALGPADASKVYLFPVLNRQKVVAVLYAEAGERPVNDGALELLAAVAGSALDTRESSKSSELVALVKEIREQPRPAQSAWSQLNREEQELHLKAQRFARVQVAEMRLYKSQAVKTGRSKSDLYGALKLEIDSGREAFRRQFLDKSETMVDYFHLELSRTLANEDVALLGPDYPGPLVS